MHEPLIPKWMFDAINAMGNDKKGSRAGADPNVHPYTRRTYRYRGRVICDCGRRMMGHRHKLGYTYYRCWPTNNNRGRPDKHAGHPRTVYVREEAITAVVDQAFSQFLFHPQRRTLLTGDMDRAEQHARQERSERRGRLQRRTADLTRRQDNLLRQAEDADPTDPFTQALRQRYNDLQTERQLILDEITALDAQDSTEPRRASEAELDLLDALPHLALNLDRAPDELQQRLFELTKLRVEIHYKTREATLVITLPREDLAAVAIAGTALQRPNQSRTERLTLAKPQVEASVNAVGAPGEIPTATARSAPTVSCCFPPPLRYRGTGVGRVVVSDEPEHRAGSAAQPRGPG